MFLIWQKKYWIMIAVKKSFVFMVFQWLLDTWNLKIWETERDGENVHGCMSWGRGRGKESSSRLLAECGPWHQLDPMTHEIMSWAEAKSQILNLLSHPATPSWNLEDNFLLRIYTQGKLPKQTVFTLNHSIIFIMQNKPFLHKISNNMTLLSIIISKKSHFLK